MNIKIVARLINLQFDYPNDARQFKIRLKRAHWNHNEKYKGIWLRDDNDTIVDVIVSLVVISESDSEAIEKVEKILGKRKS